MNLWTNLRREKTDKAKATLLWQHYLERQRPDNLEPNWIYPGYHLAKILHEGGKLDSEDLMTFRQVVGSHELPDGHEVLAFPDLPKEMQPVRKVHDGWKLGTPTWVFMGRKFNAEDLGDGWVLVARESPYTFDVGLTKSKIAYIAYNKDIPIGMTALTSNVIGPCLTREDIIERVKREKDLPYFTQDIPQRISDNTVNDGQNRRIK